MQPKLQNFRRSSFLVFFGANTSNSFPLRNVVDEYCLADMLSLTASAEGNKKVIYFLSPVYSKDRTVIFFVNLPLVTCFSLYPSHFF